MLRLLWITHLVLILSAVFSPSLFAEGPKENCSVAERLERALNRSHFSSHDSSDSRFSADGVLDNQGALTLSFYLKTRDGLRSKVLRGKDEFKRILEYFGDRVKQIKGEWSTAAKGYTDNIEQFNEWTKPIHNKTLEQAAALTWTGQQAAAAGYTRVKIVHIKGRPGNYSEVEVIFEKPKKSK